MLLFTSCSLTDYIAVPCDMTLAVGRGVSYGDAFASSARRRCCVIILYAGDTTVLLPPDATYDNLG